MKYYKYLLLLVITVCFAAVSCKKDNIASAIKLTVLDTGKTISLTKGQTIKVTLGNPGDGGFTFDAWKYDSTILHLDSHTRILPTNTNATGDFGADAWQFTTLKSGTTSLSITATQSPAYIVTMFNSTIKVQ